MNESRPTKKQQELLNFIDSFIRQHGYGPSYREIMRLLDYKSVSTVAVHVDGLITRGLLRKKDRSARSLEVVEAEKNTHSDDTLTVKQGLKKLIDARFDKHMATPSLQLDHEITTLLGAYKIVSSLAEYKHLEEKVGHIGAQGNKTSGSF